MGRPLGSRNKSTLFGKEWAADATEKAKAVLQYRLDEGDLAAAQFVVKQFCPRPRGGLVMLELPQITTAAELLQAQNLVLQAVARGEIATGDGQALMSMMLQIAKTLQLVAQEEHQALPDRAPKPLSPPQRRNGDARSTSAQTADMSEPDPPTIAEDTGSRLALSFAKCPEEAEVAFPAPPLPPIDLMPFAASKPRPDMAPGELEAPTKPPLEPAFASP